MMSGIIGLLATGSMQVIVVLVAVDVVLGVIGAIVKKNFVFSKLGNFMKGPVLAYVLGFAVIEKVGEALPFLSFLVIGVFVLVVVSLAASIIRNLGKMGLLLPDLLKK